ncbi:MAG: hypothetical protein CMB11_10365 [Euryarchaeota archaeon]|nr:hypothetical protein [Euryarchaeota archaeon]
MDEARQLNEDGGDIVTGEDFPRGREAGEEGATFRIATRGANGGTVYQYYDAATLWRWAQDHRTDPLRNPWWYEDWMALRNQYAPGSLVPHWVDALPRAWLGLRATLDAATQTRFYWDDSGDQSPNPRVSYKVDSSGAKTTYAWNAEKGINYRMKKEYPPYMPEVWLAGSTEFFEFYDQPDPIFQSVSDDKNYSRLLSHENRTKGWTRYYVGPARGGERLVRQQFTRPGVDELWHYGNNPEEGRGDEYKIMVEHGDDSAAKGQTWKYRGTEKGKESLALIVFPNGQKDYYGGERGEEIRIKTELRTTNGLSITLRYDRYSEDVAELYDGTTKTTTYYNR